MKRRRENPWTAWVVAGVAAILAMSVLVVVACHIESMGVFLIALFGAILAAVFFGIMLEKRKQYLWQLAQQAMLREFLEFARENCRAQGIDTENEPFEEFLKREEENEARGAE